MSISGDLTIRPVTLAKRHPVSQAKHAACDGSGHGSGLRLAPLRDGLPVVQDRVDFVGQGRVLAVLAERVLLLLLGARLGLARHGLDY
jgi:hypothetical protein